MTVRMLTSMATSGLLAELVVPGVVHGLPEVVVESAGGVTVAERVRSGERADVVVLAEPAVARLAAEGHIVASLVRLFRSEVVLAVRDGDSATPDISTEEHLRDTLTRATGIGYSSGPSGDGLLNLLDGWGLADRLAERLVRAPSGTPVATLVAQGRVAVGVQQRSELDGAPGVRVVGPLPGRAAIRTVFAGGVLRAAAAPQEARQVLDLLASRAPGALVNRHGMEVAG